jgi:acyl-CoA synthetase (NDP forming)
MQGQDEQVMEKIEIMLHPRSIAIIGASARLQYGGRFLNNLLESGYSGSIFPINPRHEELMGVRCYPDVTSLPEAPDLAAVIVPFESTMPVLEECARTGAKTAVIITAGFAEKGTDDRRAAQQALQDFARRTGIRLCGPNCLGIANVTDRIWACSAALPDIKTITAGNIALVCQSGASAFGPFLARARDRGLDFSYIISTGNEADLDTSDFIRYCIHRPEVKAIVAYFEAIKDGEKFRIAAREALALGKAIVAIKIGRSSAGQRAALSHTASMTGADQAYDALFKQAGVIRLDDWDEVLDVTSLLMKTPPFHKKNIGIVAHSGGVASLLADKCEQIMEVPQPADATKQGLENILKGFGSSANPADITWHAFEEDLVDILNLMLNDDAYGGVVLGTAGSDKQAERIIGVAEKTQKPLAMLWTGSERETNGLRLLQYSRRVPVFYGAETLGKAIKASLYYHRIRKYYTDAGGYRGIAAGASVRLNIPKQKGPLGLMESLKLLSSFGIGIPKGGLANSVEEAGKLADGIGYPVVLKVDSPDLPHKTDLGLVKIGLRSRAEVEKAFLKMQEIISKLGSSASIRGILVQEMVAEGTEVIMGIKQDPMLGQVLLFGLGGIFTEALRDFSVRVCPINEFDAREMIHEIKGFRILEGFRGKAPADIAALEKTLLNLSGLVVATKERITELDINPLIVLPQNKGVMAVDALMVVNGA